MKEHHLYWLALAGGLAVGYFLLSGANTYGAGQWGQSTFGRAYIFGGNL